MAEVNGEVRFMLGVICVAMVCLPFIYNLEALIEDFAPEKAQRMISVVGNTLYFSAMTVALLAAGYIYYIMRGISGILTIG